ncbi:MAG: septum site-determining protein MinD, partial [Clostridia bacterium]|nr:septum site-determining protein MinD [Clostridia bacterium]
LNVDSVIDSTQIQLIGVVPEDAKIRLGAMGGEIYKRGQASYTAFSNIAGRICGKYIALSI